MSNRESGTRVPEPLSNLRRKSGEGLDPNLEGRAPTRSGSQVMGSLLSVEGGADKNIRQQVLSAS